MELLIKLQNNKNKRNNNIFNIKNVPLIQWKQSIKLFTNVQLAIKKTAPHTF